MISKNIPSPLPWYRRAVIYQIYPWSFKDSNGDGIGDLRGIIEKLDYLAQTEEETKKTEATGESRALGIGAIWLSPIYPSPMKDFGYDISNYCDIDPRFGDLATFDELVTKARARGIKIIMDLVTNHTSLLHPWFIEASSSLDNPKRDWYIWHDPKPDGSAPNNWISVSGGSMWTLDPKTNQYYVHNFLPEQPDLNWRNPEVQDEMRKIINFWIKRGVNGFRVDAASHFVEDSQFRDDPLNKEFVEGRDEPYRKYLHTFSTNQPEIKEVIGLMCEISNENEEVFIVTETYLGLEDIKKFYRFCDTPVHAPFNFTLMSLPWKAADFRKGVDNFDAALLPQDVPTHVLGNHDRTRVASQRGPMQARAAAFLQLTLRGTPFVYYGEELGMQDVGIAEKDLRDGFVKELGVSGGRDPERTPMQWDATEHAGFSTATPWLPISKDHETVNVATQEKDPQSMLTLYKTLIAFRNNSDTLLRGTYASIDTISPDVFAYVRETNTEKLLVMINFSSATINEPLVGTAGNSHRLLITSHLDIPTETEIIGTLTLRPHEACLLRVEKQ